MEFLIETQDQLDKFMHKDFKEVFIVSIPQNYNYHPALTKINSFYIKDLTLNQSYIIPLKHTEALNPNIDIEQILSLFNTIYTFDKKQQLYFSSGFDKAIDIKFDFDLDYREFFCPTLNHFYKTYPALKNLNALIPIVKLYELWNNITKQFKNTNPTSYTKFASDKITNVLYNIEKNPIMLDKTEFDHYFNTYNQSYNIFDNTVYSQYNLYNTTTRPSNHFNSINFLALNKTNGERKSFIPKNDIFVEIDFSAYHPTLVGKLINENFIGYDKIMTELNIEKQQAKQKVFRFLYGGVKEGLEKIDWFEKVFYFIENMWEKFLKEGYLENPISKKMFYKDQLGDINKQKLFNYYLQSLETSTSINKIEKVQNLLINKNTKIILYVYDSILLDMDKEERFLLKNIKDILEEDGFKIGLSYGTNYNELKKLN